MYILREGFYALAKDRLTWFRARALKQSVSIQGKSVFEFYCTVVQSVLQSRQKDSLDQAASAIDRKFPNEFQWVD